MSTITPDRKSLIEQAIKAIHSREFYAAFPEHPSPSVYGETADADGKSSFESLLNNRFTALEAQDAISWIGEEVSPYTLEPLGITYPQFSVEQVVSKVLATQNAWAKASIDARADVLIHSLELMKAKFFDIAYATMHTTGQGYMMSFQASGPHSADRALEAIAMAYEELSRFPSQKMTWNKPMGKVTVSLDKIWRAVPKGIGLVIGCTTFPVWNTLPGLYASLMTGNPVIVKPHAKSVASIAIVVGCIQQAMKSAGFDANTCMLAMDTAEAPITKELVTHPAITVIDYTGGPQFGAWVEANAAGKSVFTEKAGVNSIILDSAEDLDAVCANLAFSVSLYSGQMCTCPQNFFIPKAGIKIGDEMVSARTFAEKLAAAITALATNPKAGPFVLGAIQNPATAERLAAVQSQGVGEVILASQPLVNPQFPNARTATPSVILLSSKEKALYGTELFGPIALIIETSDTKESISLASSLASTHGAISCGAYTTSGATMEAIMEGMAQSRTSVSFNLTGGIYVNQNAAFSDFHVSGGNPAGNASFTNPEFVVKRFTWVGYRMPAALPA